MLTNFYRDDFCIVNNGGIASVRNTKQEVKRFLEEDLRLVLPEAKTTITHVNDGFYFLGYHIQRVCPEGRWVVHLHPTTKSMLRIKAKVKSLTTRG